MAGGLGKRFWPLSRRTRPKHLIPVVGEQTLLRQTAERLAQQVGWGCLMVVTTADQAGTVRAELPELSPSHVLAEPLGRNTAACVALALRWLDVHGEADSLVGFFPSDHVVRDLQGFSHCLEKGWDLADAGRLVAFGITPTSAETGYGYIHAGLPLDTGAPPRAFTVSSFHEKPDRAHAEGWVASGEYFWNSGMFVARVRVLWDELTRHLPTTSDVIVTLGDLFTDEVLQKRHEDYAALPGISLDQGVMEKSDRMAVVESSFGWDDVGSWEAASQYWPEGEGQNRVLGRNVALVDCRGCRVRSEGLLVALVGMQDVVVVQTGDAILICHRTRAQDVKALVEGLENDRAEQYL